MHVENRIEQRENKEAQPMMSSDATGQPEESVRIYQIPR
jgi:hypothetical protein